MGFVERCLTQLGFNFDHGWTVGAIIVVALLAIVLCGILIRIAMAIYRQVQQRKSSVFRVKRNRYKTRIGKKEKTRKTRKPRKTKW